MTSAPLRIDLLGPLTVTAGAEAVPIGGARLRILLTRLALEPGRPVVSATLTDAIWPDGDGPADRNNALQSLVSRLRRTLPGDLLRSASGGYLLDIPADAVDISRFEYAATAGRRALKSGHPHDALRHLDEAHRLWRSELPCEIAGSFRIRLDELRLTVLEDRTEAALLTGCGTTDPVTDLAPFTAAYPYRERLHALHIRMLCAADRRAEALAAFEAVRCRLADDLGVDPGAELSSAHLAALRDNPHPLRGNLPAAFTSFVGRDAELEQLRELLARDRLVTLTGPGGVGKSRLALTVAAERTGPAWLIELAEVHEPGDVSRAATTVLGVGAATVLDPPRDRSERLVDALAAVDTTLILDNCEHVLDEATRLARDLLARCPRLRIIVTSREPLGLTGERICPVPPLSPGAARRLFAERAAAVRPGFRVDSGNARTVTGLCTRLDNLPLAIELAAARLRSLPLSELAERLEAGFALLTPADRTAEPRHRTLRAVIAWSWELLGPRERALARRLAVFAGGICAHSAAEVTGATVDDLAALADKSLLQFDGQRYRMLQTVRDFGLEEADRTGERGSIEAAHARYFCDLAERAEPFLRGPDQLPWIARLRAEADNLVAAFRFARRTRDTATAHRLCAALGMYWLIAGDQHTLDSWLGSLPPPQDGTPDETRAVTLALRLLTTGVWAGGAVDRTQVAELDALGSAHPFAVLIGPCLAFAENDPTAGLTVIARQLPHADDWTAAMLRLMRAALHRSTGELDSARKDLDSAVAGFGFTGERGGLAWALTARADCRATVGEFADAVADLQTAVRLLGELDPRDEAVLQQVQIAEIRARAGDIERAGRDLERLCRGPVPARDYLAFAHIARADLARRNGALGESAGQLRLAAAGFEGLPCIEPRYGVRLYCAQADLAMDTGDRSSARDHLAAAWSLANAVPDRPLAARVAVRSARLHHLDGDPVTADELLVLARALNGAEDALDADLARLAAELHEVLPPHHLTAIAPERPAAAVVNFLS